MGSAPSKKFHPETDIGDLSGKVILVTGGKSVVMVSSLVYVCRTHVTLQVLA